MPIKKGKGVCWGGWGGGYDATNRAQANQEENGGVFRQNRARAAAP